MLISVCLLLACNKPSSKNESKDDRTYFSIVQYANDQWNMYKGEPFGMVKKVYFNGTVDSLQTNAIQMDWASVFKVFFETDISDPKYVGEYDFNAYDEDLTHTRNFYYEAKSPKLYTRKLHIMTDYYTDKIKYIYIEAQKKSRLGTRNLKLSYDPLKTITIQDWETSKTGQKKEMRVVYEFL